MNEEQVMNQEEELSNEVQEVNYSGLSDEEFLKLSEPDKDEGVMMSESPLNSGSEINGDNSSNMSQEVNNQGNDNSLNSGSEISDEEFRRRITGNFNFNGRNVSINNPDDAIRLMQMGLSYRKKIDSLNQNLGLVRSLKKNGISDEDLRFLIDLKNGDKGAIAKLLKDKEIDTYDLPDLDENPYIPNAVLVDNEQATFEDTLDDIRSMRGGNELLNSLGSDTWDNESLRFFRSKPEALHYLYQDKASGLYDEVLSQIELDDTLGKIPSEVKNKPFIELYEIVASQMQNQRGNANNMNQNMGNVNSFNTGSVNSPRRVIGNNRVDENYVQRSNTNAPRSANVNSGSRNLGNNSNQQIPNFLMMTDKQFEEYEKSLNSLNFH